MNTCPLSEREYELVGYKAYGYTAEETGEKLFLSPETVKNHWKNAAVKLGIKASRVGAWFFCFTYNISMDFSPIKNGISAFAFLLLITIEIFNKNESSVTNSAFLLLVIVEILNHNQSNMCVSKLKFTIKNQFPTITHKVLKGHNSNK